MPPRKERIPVVLDTNVVVGFFLSTYRQSANQRVFRLWYHRQLQLVVSEEVVAEYLELVERMGIPQQRIDAFLERLHRRDIVIHVNLGPRFAESRDPDDNIMLATAVTGKAKFLITNDRDLLDIPTERQRKFKFEIVTPQEFLVQLAE